MSVKPFKKGSSAKKAFNTDTFRLISTTKKRFITLVAIVFVGTAFMMGLLSSSYIMRHSVDVYADEYHLQDIQIYSNYGFCDDDLEAINNVEGVERVFGSRFVDCLAIGDDNEKKVTRVRELDSNVNEFILVEGRYPQNDSECLGLYSYYQDSLPEGGYHIHLIQDEEDDLSEILENVDYTIVGLIISPEYMSEFDTYSTFHNLTLENTIYVDKDNFLAEYYTSAYLCLSDADTYDSFSDQYFDYVDQGVEDIENLAKTQKDVNKNAIVLEAEEEIADAREELSDAKKEAEAEFADARRKLADADKEINDGKEAINDGKKKLKEGQDELDSNRQQLDEGKSQLNEQIAQIEKDSGQSFDDLYASTSTLYNVYCSMGELTYPETKEGLEQLSSTIEQNETDLQGIQYQKTLIKENLCAVLKQIDEVQNNTGLDENEKQSTLAQLQQEYEAKTAQLTILIGNEYALEVELAGNKKQLDYGNALLNEQDDIKKDSFNEFYAAFSKEMLEQVNNDILQNEADLIAVQDKEEAYILQVELMANQIKLGTINAYPAIRQQKIDEARANLDEMAGGSVLESYQGLEEIRRYQLNIEQGYASIDAAQALLDKSEKQLLDAEEEIKEGEETYNSSLSDYYQALNDYQQEISDAEEEIAQACQDLADLSDAEWTVLDRTKHYSSALYKSNSAQMHNIGIAFPILFFLVAALVCMTTMTRLIDEQRNEIGCLSALGYSRNAIISKYVIYAGLASFCGALPGVFFGVVTFPVVIYMCWGLMYRNPDISLYLPLLPLMVSFFSFIVLICLVTYFVARSSLKENPASLMRPKAPKTMRKTFIEKISFIWDKLSFTSKITARNIIRYKQRFFMTVIGVAGCCGLLIIGFGVSDSISTIINEQYGGIMHMSHQATLSDSQYKDEIITYVSKEYDASNITSFLTYTTSVKFADNEATAKAVIGSEEDLNKYVSLTDYDTKKTLELSTNGVIITKKFAVNNDIKYGDTIKMEAEDGSLANVRVEGIATMYYEHYIFMRSELYNRLYNTEVKENTVTFITEMADDVVDADLLKQEGIDSVTDIKKMTSSFNTMIQSLDLITIVIILAAGFLALVVLINLTEVNISERKREIATLKVLGFRPHEVRSYIYKELIVLTLIGSLFGVPFGKYGLKFIMNVLNIDLICFPVKIDLSSYLISFAITYAFLFIILIMEKRSLQNIKMVESLKSVE